eukprot:Nk52_evm22s217 gene=Nk52_evmTU22s217
MAEEGSSDYQPSFAYQGNYDDDTVDISLKNTSSYASPYALNLDPVILTPASSGEAFQRQDAGSKRLKGFGERMTYTTGTSYLCGLTVGGVWGLYEGVRYPEGKSFNLRVNSILNSCGRRGPLIGNSMGSLAVMYSFIDGVVVKARGEDDMFNTIGSAALTGALYKSTAGLRAVGVGGAFGGILATAYVAGMKMLGKDEEAAYLGYSVSGAY